MKKKIIFLIILFGIFTINPVVLASEIWWPDSPFDTILDPDGSRTGTPSTLTDMVRYFYEWGIFIGGLAVFISLIIGGFLYLTSMGNPARMSEARDRIFSALIGLVLLFSIYLILNTINPELTFLAIPETGIGAPCNTDDDCPDGVKCEGDPDPRDKRKEGTCIFKIEFGCDTNEDCPEGSECNDPNPGDGVKEGICISTEEAVTRCDVNEDCPPGQICSGGDPDTEDIKEGFCIQI